MMNNNVMLSKDSVILIRRIISLISFLMSCTFLIMLVFGYIPFNGKNMTIINALDFILYITAIGKRGFWYCALSVGFAVFYLWTAVKMLIELFKNFIPSYKLWWSSKFDSLITRSATDNAVYIFNSNITRFFTLYLSSYLIDSFDISTGAWLLNILFTLVFVGINGAYSFYRNRNISESCAVSIATGLVLFAGITFTFSLPASSLSEIIEGTIDMIASMLQIGNIELEFVITPLFQYSLLPLVQIWTALSVIGLLKKLDNDELELAMERARRFMIRNIIFTAVIVIALGYADGGSSVTDYSKPLLDHISLILVPIAVYISIICRKRTLKDVDVYDSAPSSQES